MKKHLTVLTALITIMAIIPVAVNITCIESFFNLDSGQAVNVSSVISDTQNSEYTLPENITFTDKSSEKEVTRSTKSVIYSLVGAAVDENFNENEIKALAIAYHTQLCRENENETLCIDTSDSSFFLKENELKNKFGKDLTTLYSYCDNVYSSLIMQNSTPANLNILSLSSDDSTNDSISPKANPFCSLTSDYLTVISFDEDEFCEKIKTINNNIDTSISPQQFIGNINYAANGEVESIFIGGVKIKGSDIASTFALPYKRFTLLYSLGEYQFTVMQCDVSESITPSIAHLMSEQGNTFDEILNYCYSDL